MYRLKIIDTKKVKKKKLVPLHYDFVKLVPKHHNLRTTRRSKTCQQTCKK